MLALDHDHPNGRCKFSEPTGGMIVSDEENIATKVVKELLKKIGSALFSGNLTNLRGISIPAYVHS